MQRQWPTAHRGPVGLAWVLIQLVLVTALRRAGHRAGHGTAAPGVGLGAARRSGSNSRIPARSFARRRQIASLRHVPASEVAGLQVRGRPPRLASYLRSPRSPSRWIPSATTERRVGVRPPVRRRPIAWLVVLAFTVIAARGLITDGVPDVRPVHALPRQPAWPAPTRLRSGWSDARARGHGGGPDGSRAGRRWQRPHPVPHGLWHTVAVRSGCSSSATPACGGSGVACSPSRALRSSRLIVIYAAVPLPSGSCCRSVDGRSGAGLLCGDTVGRSTSCAGPPAWNRAAAWRRHR